MPGGATSSSQEGAMKQGYIHLLPYMLKFLAGTRRIVRYHDVTPGSQITWNTAFLAVTGAYKRGDEREVRHLLETLDEVTTKPESELSPAVLEDRLRIYQDANDAFRDLLLGKYGRLPLGFPPDWVYQSAFGPEFKQAIAQRRTDSPLESLPEMDLFEEHKALVSHLDRTPTDEEFVMYLNHPGDALNTINFLQKYGDPNNLPLDIWFEGLQQGETMNFVDSEGKPHAMTIVHISRPDERGMSMVRYILDSDNMSHQVKVKEPVGLDSTAVEMADSDNPFHVAAPSSGDLWVMHVAPGDYVKKGEELFNISIMKQEKAVYAPQEGMILRVLKDADYKEDRKMVPVKGGELLVEMGPVPRVCSTCKEPVLQDEFDFCPYCGQKM
jgi:pyruvate carboxylase